MKNSMPYAALALLILSGAALSQGTTPDAPDRRELPRSVAVYVSGGLPDDHKAAVGDALLAALVNSGAAVAHPNAAGFVANADHWEKHQVLLTDGRLSELGRHYGVKYICAAAVTQAPGGFTISARMLNTETERAKLTGNATTPLKTTEDLAAAANEIVEKMLGDAPPRRRRGPKPPPRKPPRPKINPPQTSPQPPPRPDKANKP